MAFVSTSTAMYPESTTSQQVLPVLAPNPAVTSSASSTQLVALAGFEQAGVISTEELVQLAPRVASGVDADIVPAITAILGFKDAAPDVFARSICALLAERGLARSMRVPTPVPVATNTDLAAASGDKSSFGDIGDPNSNVPTPAPASAAAADVTPTTTQIEEVVEVVVLCIDVSGSMDTTFERDPDTRITDRTRLQAVKQCFYGFRDRTQRFADGSRHRLGLLSFSEKIKVHTPPTGDFDVFEADIDAMKTDGTTAIFEAVVAACSLLEPFAKRYPSADLRVVVLTDGQNNCNTVRADDALKALAACGAVCDCMLLGGGADQDLRRLVAASEGVCVEITGLADAYEALESPAMVSLAARRGGAPLTDRAAFRAKLAALPPLAACAVAPVQRGAVSAVAPSAGQRAFEQSSFTAALEDGAALKGWAGGDKSGTSAKNKRIARELEALALVAGTYVFPSADEPRFAKVLLAAPPASPYAGRLIEAHVVLPDDYPFKPPRVTFAHPVYHYAVSTAGGVCLPALLDGWSPGSSLAAVFAQLSALLHDPRTADPTAELAQRAWLSELLRTDPAAYHAQATADAALHAKLAPAGVLTAADVFHLLR